MVKPISWFGHETDMEPILHAPLLFMNCPYLHFHLNPFLPGSLTDFCDNTHTNFSYLKVRFHLHSHHKLLAILGRIAQLPSLMNNHIHKWFDLQNETVCSQTLHLYFDSTSQPMVSFAKLSKDTGDIRACFSQTVATATLWVNITSALWERTPEAVSCLVGLVVL